MALPQSHGRGTVPDGRSTAPRGASQTTKADDGAQHHWCQYGKKDHQAAAAQDVTRLRLDGKATGPSGAGARGAARGAPPRPGITPGACKTSPAPVAGGRQSVVRSPCPVTAPPKRGRASLRRWQPGGRRGRRPSRWRWHRCSATWRRAQNAVGAARNVCSAWRHAARPSARRCPACMPRPPIVSSIPWSDAGACWHGPGTGRR